MLAEQLIVENIPPLSTSHTGETALRWMDEFKVTHLSVVDDRKFLGTISESDVLGMADVGEAIGKYRELYNPTFVLQTQHIFEVVKVVNDHMLSIIPVLDSNETYLGSITIAQLMRIIAEMPVANHPGGIIVIEMNTNDYSLQNITGIIEENNVKILGTFITSHPDSTKIQLTIKVNETDIASVISSLERHDYNVKWYGKNTDLDNDIRDRFDSLMKFLDL
ncbi:MAG: hypothetical protein Kow0075_03260 [Salibacteraceae bacterium]